MKWFRLYSEIASDPKVMSIPEALRWRLVALFCLAAQLDADGKIRLSDEEIRTFFRISPTKLEKTISVFLQKGFIEPLDNNHEGYRVTNWNKRQYRSDTSRNRTRKWREKRRHRDVTVTAPEQIQNRTEKNPPHTPPLGGGGEEKSETLLIAEELVEEFIGAILEYKQDWRRPTATGKRRWVADMERLIRIDGRDPEKVVQVIRWVQSDRTPRGADGFCWARVVLSPKKLRKHFDRLEMEMDDMGDRRVLTEEELDAALKESVG